MTCRRRRRSAPSRRQARAAGEADRDRRSWPASGLVRAAEESGRVLAVAEEYRLSPLVRAAHRAIKEGLLGRVTLVQVTAAGPHRPAQEWKNRRASMGGGVLIDVGVHYVDILRSCSASRSRVGRVSTPPQRTVRGRGQRALPHSGSRAGQWRVSPCPGPATAALARPRSRSSGSGARWSSGSIVHFWFTPRPLPARHWSGRLRDILPWRVASRLNRFLPRSGSARIAVA